MPSKVYPANNKLLLFSSLAVHIHILVSNSVWPTLIVPRIKLLITKLPSFWGTGGVSAYVDL